MARTPGKLLRFWQELKRRRVIHVITVYASASFVIIELINNLADPLNLPDHLATIVIIVLAVGFPLAIILSWLYDLTSEGVEKTRSLEETKQGDKPAVPNAWRIATIVSFVVIVGLVTFNIFGGAKQLRAGDIQSLVILPFDNYTGDDQLENMVASMHSLLIGDMGRLSGLRVIGKTSSNVYKGVHKSAPDIASELNVDAVVEATVMCLGDTVCMQFRLISTTGEEEQLWVGDYKEDKSQFLNLYNRVTKQIAEEVLIELTDSEEKVLRKDRAAGRDAMDAYIRSYAYWGDLSADDLNKAEEYLSLAIEKDPDWAAPYAALGVVWAARMQMGSAELEPGRQKLYENLNKANELDPDFDDSHFIYAVVSTWVEWNWDKGEKEFLQALAINPNHVMGRMYYAHLLMTLQRMDEALVQGKLALDLDPMNPLVLALYSVLLKGAGQHQSALKYIEKALSIDPEHSFTRAQLGRAYYNTGEFRKDLELEEKYLSRVFAEKIVPDLDSLFLQNGRQAAYEEVVRLWELYAENHKIRPISQAIDYYRIGAYTKTLDLLEQAYAMHEPNLPYIGTGTRYEALHDSARFKAILNHMNLPLPKD